MTHAEALRHEMEVSLNFRRTSKPDDYPYPYLCVEDLLMRYGHPFERSRRRPPVEPVGRACYHQSYRIATRARSPWIYCEGYGLRGKFGLVVPHAWVMHRDAPTEAVDLAWPEDEPDLPSAYFGISFLPEFVRATHAKSKWRTYGVLDTPWLHYPLLTGETNIEDVMWRSAR